VAFFGAEIGNYSLQCGHAITALHTVKHTNGAMKAVLYSDIETVKRYGMSAEPNR